MCIKNKRAPQRKRVPIAQVSNGTHHEIITMDTGTGELHFAAAGETTLGAGGISPQDIPKLEGELSGVVEATYADVEMGEFEEELRGRDGLVLYRKVLTDSSVKQALGYRKDAMRNTRFRVKPASQDPLHLEQAAWLADQLGLGDVKAGKYGFQRLIALHEMSRIYRRAFGELVFAPGPDGKFVLDKITPLHPLTVEKVEYDPKGGPKAVVQKGKIRGEDGKQIEKKIPIWKTVMFTNEDDGVTEGESILRPILVHWRIKRALMVLMNQGLERYSLGVPKLTLPATVKPDSPEWDAARMVCINYVTRPRLGVVVPEGWEFEILNMAGSLPEMIPYLEYHDAAIMRGLGVEFSSLGAKEGVAVPVAAQMSMTAQAVQAMVQEFCSDINLYLAPKVVLMNWPDETRFPRLVADVEDPGDQSAAANLFGMVMNGAIDLVVAEHTAEKQMEQAEIAAAAKPAGPAGKAGAIAGGASRSGSGKTPSAKFAELAGEQDAGELAGKVTAAMQAIIAAMPTRMRRLIGALEDEQEESIAQYRTSAQTVRAVDGRKPNPQA